MKNFSKCPIVQEINEGIYIQVTLRLNRNDGVNDFVFVFPTILIRNIIDKIISQDGPHVRRRVYKVTKQ